MWTVALSQSTNSPSSQIFFALSTIGHLATLPGSVDKLASRHYFVDQCLRLRKPAPSLVGDRRWGGRRCREALRSPSVPAAQPSPERPAHRLHVECSRL